MPGSRRYAAPTGGGPPIDFSLVGSLPHREASMNPSIMFVVVEDMHVRLCPLLG